MIATKKKIYYFVTINKILILMAFSILVLIYINSMQVYKGSHYTIHKIKLWIMIATDKFLLFFYQ